MDLNLILQKKRGQIYSFVVGEGRVIKGWQEVITTMKKGEICKLTILPEYGYGDNERDIIPANSILVFEIELLNFSNEKDLSKNKDGGIIKKVLEEGEFGSGNPIYESAVILTYICKLEDGTIIERCSEKMFELGDDRLCEGLERVIESMKIKEKAWVKIAPAYAYGENGIDKIPPNSTLIYEVVLHEFQKAKEP